MICRYCGEANDREATRCSSCAEARRIKAAHGMHSHDRVTERVRAACGHAGCRVGRACAEREGRARAVVREREDAERVAEQREESAA